MSSRTSSRNRAFATVVAAACVAAVTLLPSGAGAAIVPTVPLGTAAEYAVLAGSTVTNTGPSRLHGSLGLWDAPATTGTAVTGFGAGAGDGQVVPPATTNIDNGAAEQAQSDLTAAYLNAEGRPGATVTGADLANQILQGGVYAATPDRGALGLTGPLTLDGAGNADSVFIFQTNSTLITGPGSTVNLINGAQACNVFWQVGSSATLDTDSVFVGNILALTSITVNRGVTVHGRALARNGAVTLIDDTFRPTACAAAPPVIDGPIQFPPTTPTTATPTTTTTTAAPTTTTTAPPSTTTTTRPVATTPTTTPGALPGAGAPVAGPTPGGPVAGSGGPGAPLVPSAPGGPAGPTGGGGTGTATPGGGITTATGTPTGRITTSSATPGTSRPSLPRTGSPLGLTFLVGLCLVAVGAGAVRLGRTEQ